LDAFTHLVGALPLDTGMCFVLVQHLAPDHPSLLPDILSRATALPVVPVEDGLRVAPNHIYVIPPNTTLRLEGGSLRLAPRPAGGLHLPIDHFFRSLASEQRRLSIGVVLSGAGSDGSQGILAIKEECGIVIAQDESSAQYGGMPHSALQTGAVDYVLPPVEIGHQLARLSHNAFVVSGTETCAEEVLPAGEAELQKIYLLLERASHVDFALYKQMTIRRRLGRRMIVCNCATIAEYLAHVQRRPEELLELYKDILISVTSFFRDPDSFTALAQQLTATARDTGTGGNVRVWVPGCATGEEVYSLAIILREIFERDGIRVGMQLFGTDLSESALQRARAGVYPDRIVENVSEERLRQFFHRVEGGYQISKALRDSCLFAKQDIARDPPFSRTDLISCRNVLIYLGSALQKAIFPVFHYSLKPKGLLFLGSAETVVDAADLFEAEDAPHRIFRRKDAPVRLGAPFPRTTRIAEPNIVQRKQRHIIGADLQKRADQAIQDRFAPDGVVVNADMQILQFRGQTGFYLEPTPGEATHHLLRMAHESLRPILKNLIAVAIEQNKWARQPDVCVEHRGEIRNVNLEVIPIAGEVPAERYYLIVFERIRTSAPAPPGEPLAEPRRVESESEESARLKQELTQAREYLGAEIQDHEAAMEEVRAANEEVSSANEELQSANEQLATAKEELQSANEELSTINDELKARNDELALLSNDLANVLSSVNIPILMVDRNLRLRRYTPSISQHFGINAGDTGRLLTDLNRQLPWAGLDEMAEHSISLLTVTTKELQDEQGRWWSLTARPYRTVDHRIEGAVLTFADIDLLHCHLLAVQEERDFSDAIVSTVREPLLVLTHDFRVQRANPAFYQTFNTTEAEIEGRRFYELQDGQWNLPSLRHVLEEVLRHSGDFSDLEVEHVFKHIGRRTVKLNGRRILRNNATAQTILLAIEDITAEREGERALMQSNADLERFAYVVSHDLQEPLRSIGAFTELLRKRLPSSPDADTNKFMELIVEGVARMNHLIRDLLAYSRVGRAEPESIEVFPAEAALQEALWNLQGLIIDAGAIVTHDALPIVTYNRQQLTQVFQNLVGNAVKYRRAPESPRVYVSVTRHNTEWVFSIRDNGIGFEIDQAERIFDVFMRLHGRDFEGTGIGLAICKRIVEHHGGRIWADSHPGIGSTFLFTILGTEAPEK
jgi:two-component system CheB/CheR fusion protein